MCHTSHSGIEKVRILPEHMCHTSNSVIEKGEYFTGTQQYKKFRILLEHVPYLSLRKFGALFSQEPNLLALLHVRT